MRRKLATTTTLLIGTLTLSGCSGGIDGIGGSSDNTRTASFEGKTSSQTDQSVLLPFTVTVRIGGAAKVNLDYTTTDREGKKTVPLSDAGCASEAQTMIPISITARNDATSGYADIDPDIDILDAKGSMLSNSSPQEVRIAWLEEGRRFSCESTRDGLGETNMGSDPLQGTRVPIPKIQGVILLPGKASDFDGYQLAITAGREDTVSNIKGADEYANRGIKVSLS